MPGTAGWLWALFGWLLLPLGLLDARHMWLPDRLNAVLAVAGIFLAGPLLETSLLDRWIGALAGGSLLALVAWSYRRLRGGEGMGGGDPKLVAAIGCWLGWQPLPLVLLLARSEEHTSELQSLMRISYAVFCLKKKKVHRKKTIQHDTRLNSNEQDANRERK